MNETITMQVTRYRPDKNTQPVPVDYQVPLRKEWTVLDGLNHIKAQRDETLSFRWSCRMGICGSCGMNVDGEPRLTCGTFLSDYAPGPVRVEPLANFPIVKDLVVDMSDFMEKLPRVKPWIIRDDDVTEIDGEYLQTPEELDAYKQFSMCINCMLCYAACPVYGLDPDFVGPAAIALAERYDLDSRDHGSRERLDVLIEREGVWGCTFVGECTKVCPKHVDPAGAIQRYKLKAAQESVKAFLLPKALRRTRTSMSTQVTRVPSYQRRMGVFWWVHKRSYFLFVMRELSSLFVAWFVIYLLMFIAAVGGGAGEVRRVPRPRVQSPVPGRERRGAGVPRPAHDHVVRPDPAGDGAEPRGHDACRACVIIAAQYAGLAAVSAFIYWLVVLA